MNHEKHERHEKEEPCQTQVALFEAYKATSTGFLEPLPPAYLLNPFRVFRAFRGYFFPATYRGYLTTFTYRNTKAGRFT